MSQPSNPSAIDILENSLRKRGVILDILLLDMTRTNKNKNHNIIWATDSYTNLWRITGSRNIQPFGYTTEIRPELVTGEFGTIIQPRAAKSKLEQQRRTKDKAEVFTPLFVVDKMNQSIWDNLHFATANPTWQDYVNAKWLEITCGEGPFIASRYDPTSTEQMIIPPADRVGFLDRKLQLVNDNCQTKDDWLKWAEVALKSSYGYEWQGDNLLITRENILMTINDFYKVKFETKPNLDSQRAKDGGLSTKQLEYFAEIIAWNFFQMDGLKQIIPMSDTYKPKILRNLPTQANIFNVVPAVDIKQITSPSKPDKNAKPIKAKLMNWQTNKPIEFRKITTRPTSPKNPKKL